MTGPSRSQKQWARGTMERIKWENWRVILRVLTSNDAIDCNREYKRRSLGEWTVKYILLGYYFFVFNKHRYFPGKLPWVLKCWFYHEVNPQEGLYCAGNPFSFSF